MIMRAQSYTGISKELIALLGGYGSMMLAAEGADKSKVMDASEDKIIGKEEEADKENIATKKKANNSEKEESNKENDPYDEDNW
jgi:hypothetical protein